MCNCCVLVNKIPADEMDFIFDQRSNRQYTIQQPVFAAPDVPSVSERPEVPEVPNVSEGPEASDTQGMPDECGSEIDDIPLESGSEFVPSSTVSTPSTAFAKRQRYLTGRRFPKLAEECDRYNVSDRVAAILVTSAFYDIGLKDNDGQLIIIDKNRIRRERESNRARLLRLNALTANPKAFAFDSRKDETLVEKRYDDESLHPQLIKEEHITILKQPGSKLLGFAVASEDSSLPAIAQCISQFFQDRNIDLSILVGICCDGEAKNTGRLTGILRSFEVKLQRPLHWFVCLIHFNELVRSN